MNKAGQGPINKSIITLAYFSFVVFCLSLSQVAIAIPIDRADFSGSAITYGFDGDAIGATTAGSGILSISQGTVSGFNWAGVPLVEPTYNNQSSGSALRLDFSSDVSAIGLDFVSNNSDVSVSIYDSSDIFIDSLVLSYIGLPLQNGEASGFIGLDAGMNNISYAIFDTPTTQGFDLYIDNIIYQQVPEPASLALMGLGLIGLGFARRKEAA